MSNSWETIKRECLLTILSRWAPMGPFKSLCASVPLWADLMAPTIACLSSILEAEVLFLLHLYPISKSKILTIWNKTKTENVSFSGYKLSRIGALAVDLAVQEKGAQSED
jgi:hypothetical protein